VTRSLKSMVLASALASVGVAAIYVRASAQVVTPPPEELRYQALISEPIAVSNRRGVVAGTSALLLKDRVTGQCFLAVTVGSSMGLSPAGC
jgi:hypothetical protein